MSVVGPLKLKAQIMCGDDAAMGPGKAMVLDAIARTGSISAAGRDLGMSYRRTWLLVDSMNRCWSERLVETHKGGGEQGGARLTGRGRAILDAFRNLERRLEAAAFDGDYELLIEGLLTLPAPDPEPSEKKTRR